MRGSPRKDLWEVRGRGPCSEVVLTLAGEALLPVTVFRAISAC